MPLYPLPIESIPGDMLPKEAHALFAERLADLLEYEKWQYLSRAILDDNCEEWSDAAAPLAITTEETTWARGIIQSMRLEHATAESHLPTTIDRGALTTHAYRSQHPDTYGRTHLGNQVPYEEVLGLNGYISWSFPGYSPMSKYPARLTLPALRLLESPDTLVFPYDAPLMGTMYSLEVDVARNQAMALRGPDYLKLLPKYMIAEERGLDIAAYYPDWVRVPGVGPRTYRLAEIRTLGNVSLRPDDPDWKIEVPLTWLGIESVLDQLDPDVRELRIVDTSPK